MANDIQIPRRLRTLPSWLLSQASLRAHALLTQGLGNAGARGHHYRLLAALDDLGPASQAVLGRATGLDRSDVTVAVSELVQSGAITRTPSVSDRRSHTISLTAAGRQWLDELDETMAAVQAQLLAPLTKSERRQLTRLLARIQPSRPQALTRPSDAETPSR